MARRNPIHGVFMTCMGNVWEWVQDRRHDNYKGAPSDGSAWEDGDSPFHMVRGGSWLSIAKRCRSASRSRDDDGYHVSDVGFRLLRNL